MKYQFYISYIMHVSSMLSFIKHSVFVLSFLGEQKQLCFMVVVFHLKQEIFISLTLLEIYNIVLCSKTHKNILAPINQNGRRLSPNKCSNFIIKSHLTYYLY